LQWKSPLQGNIVFIQSWPKLVEEFYNSNELLIFSTSRLSSEERSNDYNDRLYSIDHNTAFFFPIAKCCSEQKEKKRRQKGKIGYLQ